jgi:hypothetical protein
MSTLRVNSGTSSRLLQECERESKNKNRGKADQKFFGIAIEHGFASAEIRAIDT